MMEMYFHVFGVNSVIKRTMTIMVSITSFSLISVYNMLRFCWRQEFFWQDTENVCSILQFLWLVLILKIILNCLLFRSTELYWLEMKSDLFYSLWRPGPNHKVF